MWSVARAICKFAFFLFAFVLEVISHQEAFLRFKRVFFSSFCHVRVKITMKNERRIEIYFAQFCETFLINACESSPKQTIGNIKINRAIDFSWSFFLNVRHGRKMFKCISLADCVYIDSQRADVPYFICAIKEFRPVRRL